MKTEDGCCTFQLFFSHFLNLKLLNLFVLRNISKFATIRIIWSEPYSCCIEVHAPPVLEHCFVEQNLTVYWPVGFTCFSYWGNLQTYSKIFSFFIFQTNEELFKLGSSVLEELLCHSVFYRWQLSHLHVGEESFLITIRLVQKRHDNTFHNQAPPGGCRWNLGHFRKAPSEIGQQNSGGTEKRTTTPVLVCLPSRFYKLKSHSSERKRPYKSKVHCSLKQRKCSFPLAFPSSSPIPQREESPEQRFKSVSRSAPEADVAHTLAGGAALCGGEVDLAAGADAHLEHGLLLGWRCSVDAKRQAAQPDGAGV